ncbi:MAG: carboxypeptidase regulatory-like domain-containing protein [Acidobacteria bacterium]|nr:carboxypeptidase regulatory-like domain-containing protein [Acidobacteriota bacterium]
MKSLSFALILLAFSLTANAAQTGKAPPLRNPANRGQKLAGRVVDEAGRPLFEVAVQAIPAGLSGKASKFAALNMRSVTSDENGNFAFEDMAAGAYRLTAILQGYTLAAEALDENGRARFYRPGDNIQIRMLKGGVITGTVFTSGAEPLVGVRVYAFKIKDPEGRAVQSMALDEMALTREWKTDDRGIYRIYGLEPGRYLVSAGGKGFNPMSTGEFDSDAPTFYPTGTRDMAAEVNVIAGQETTGIDIRYRENKGHIISGQILADKVVGSKVNLVFLMLANAATGNLENFSMSGLFGGKDNDNQRSFALTSVADGEYIVSAVSAGIPMLGDMSGESYVSKPLRVKVKGGDVTGLELSLLPLGTIKGQLVIEKTKAEESKATCPASRKFAFEEVVIVARDDAKKKALPELKLPSLFSSLSLSPDSVPDEKGAFKILTMDASRYRLEVKLPNEELYIRAISVQKAGATTASKESRATVKATAKPLPEEAATALRDVARSGFVVKLGDTLENVLITAAEGAASLRGHLKAEKDGQALPPRLRIFLVPAEADRTDEVLRYFETDMQRDGTFAISNVAPGRYFLLTRLVNEQTLDELSRPVAWDSELRMLLHSEAEAKNIVLDLQPCQRLNDYVIRYASAAPSKQP